jgi:hypothetical protein
MTTSPTPCHTALLQVIRPRMASIVAEDRLADMCYVKLSHVKEVARTAAAGKQAGRWATVAVLSAKCMATTKRGDNYSRWTLSDLNDGEVRSGLGHTACSGLGMVSCSCAVASICGKLVAGAGSSEADGRADASQGQREGASAARHQTRP